MKALGKALAWGCRCRTVQDDADVDEEEVKEKLEEADKVLMIQNEGQKQEALEDEWADAGWVSWQWEEEWFWKWGWIKCKGVWMEDKGWLEEGYWGPTVYEDEKDDELTQVTEEDEEWAEDEQEANVTEGGNQWKKLTSPAVLQVLSLLPSAKAKVGGLGLEAIPGHRMLDIDPANQHARVQ